MGAPVALSSLYERSSSMGHLALSDVLSSITSASYLRIDTSSPALYGTIAVWSYLAVTIVEQSTAVIVTVSYLFATTPPIVLA